MVEDMIYLVNVNHFHWCDWATGKYCLPAYRWRRLFISLNARPKPNVRMMLYTEKSYTQKEHTLKLWQCITVPFKSFIFWSVMFFVQKLNLGLGFSESLQSWLEGWLPRLWGHLCQKIWEDYPSRQAKAATKTSYCWPLRSSVWPTPTCPTACTRAPISLPESSLQNQMCMDRQPLAHHRPLSRL